MKPTLLSKQILEKRIFLLLLFFIISLVLSGITAFPLETELALLVHLVPQHSEIYPWLNKVYTWIKFTNENFPFMAYGTDWLAFAHLVIAIAFIGPLRDPVKNIWVIEFGIIACVAIIPLAIVAGHIREIPVYWRIIDCSFGIIGIIPLLICRHYIKVLGKKDFNSNFSFKTNYLEEYKIYEM